MIRLITSPAEGSSKESAMKAEVVGEGFKAFFAIVGAVVSAITLNQIVAFLTALYIIVQAAYLIRKWYKEEKEWSRKESHLPSVWPS